MKELVVYLSNKEHYELSTALIAAKKAYRDAMTALGAVQREEGSYEDHSLSGLKTLSFPLTAKSYENHNPNL